MSQPVVVARALLRAGSAFLSALAPRPRESAPVAAPEKPRPPLSSAPPSPGVDNRCPVCQARFRGARICSRCGADLEPLMLLTAKAWQLRQAARRALDAGDAEQALDLALEAQAIQSTQSGEALRLLAAWLC